MAVRFTNRLGSLVYRVCFASSLYRSRSSHHLIALRPVFSIRRAGSGRCLCLRRGRVVLMSARRGIISGSLSPCCAGLLASLSCPLIASRLVLRAVLLPVPLLFVLRTVIRQAERGDVLRWSSSDGFVDRAVACRSWGGVSCPHGVLSSRPVLAVGTWCVGCVDRATACRSCGIFVLSIGCIYRLIGFLICPVCLLLLLSASSYR